MTLPHNDATATITIDGLAVCCFNKGANKWEVGYLHHPDPCLHKLILQIEEETPIDIAEGIREITFMATNPQTPTFPGSENGFFDPIRHRLDDRNTFPTTADEIENFRWIIDLQDPRDVGHGNATLKRASVPVTRASIQNGVFYTHKVSSKVVFQAPFTDRQEDDPNGMDTPTLQRHVFGRTNDTTAADIFCAPANGTVTITIPNVQPRVLPHRPGNPWKISLTNLCVRSATGPRFLRGDFHLFYDVLNVTGQKQAIWGERPNAARSQADRENFTGRVDCDITWLGASQTLDPIMP
jgi:hypothetical protein